MNKTELISAVSEKTEMTKKDSEKFISAFVDTVTEALEKGDKVQLIGFGTFEVRERAERTGVNPQTQQKIAIPATKVPAFKAGAALKEAVAK